MTAFKHISSKNADYGAAEQYLTFEHDEFTMKLDLVKRIGNTTFECVSTGYADMIIRD